MTKIFNFFILILLSVYSLNLYRLDKLGFYVNADRFEILIVVSNVLILLFSIIGFVFYIKKYITKESIVKTFADNKFKTIILLPLLSIITPLGFFITGIAVALPWKNSSFDKSMQKSFTTTFGVVLVLFISIFTVPTTLKSGTFSQRESNLNGTAGVVGSSAINNFVGDSTQYSIGDWIRQINIEGNIYKLEGKEVNVDGFVYKTNNSPENVFLISRFVLSCCVLDATPVGIYVDYEKWDSEYDIDDWVRVVGSMKVDNFNGKDQLVVEVNSIEPTEIPNNPYIN